MEKKNPLIINGRALAEIGHEPGRGGNSEFEERKYKRSLEEARDYLLPQMSSLKNNINSLSMDNRLNDIYFKINYPNAFLAKSYEVSSIYSSSKIEVVGSCTWIDNEGKEGRSDLLRGSEESIELLQNFIGSTKLKQQQKEIRRMEEIAILNPLISFDNENKESIYELSFYSVTDTNELIKKIEDKLSVSSKNYNVLEMEDGTVFVVLKLSNEKLKQMENFNPLRSSYAVNKRDFISASFSQSSVRNNYQYKHMDEEELKQLPWIGMIDGGVAKEQSFFATVNHIHESEAPSSEKYIEHGTSVASVLLYRDLEEEGTQELKPDFRLQSIRALPSELDIEFNLVTLDKLIKEIVPLYSNIKIWNLSIGPQGPVLDEVVSSLTRILDQVAYENDIIFVIAAGNTGSDSGISRRIQIPGDSVNNITVLAYFKQQDKLTTSEYSSIGPGREGAKLKPDILDHGGLLPIDPIYTISSYSYLLNKVHGTSFAAPHVARKLGLILNHYPELNVWQARALLEHSLALKIDSERDIFIDAKGEFDGGEEQLLFSNKDEIKVLYSGKISAKGYVLLPIPIPDNTDSKTATITWTIVTKTKVNPSSTDKYTEYGIEDDFYPNSEKYVYRKEKNVRTVNLSNEDADNQVETLIKEGYRKASYPVKENPKYIDESDRRKNLLKWDTCKTQRVRKLVKSLYKPFIRLHGLSRSDTRDRIEYALVVTVRYHDDAELYTNVMNKYAILQPLNVQQTNLQRV
ncbi:S8 family peptidase [Enterococcus faecalis]|uniref:S8 family peptidase n=1 Tax=Enterococcus TaxID=1350 RepID=UPI00070FA73A|nr:S8 family peptidase [Enterococcus faecalis]KXF71373.1 peptidase S8 [Enterococcus faecalis]KXF73873.1 peptidase S8 [Enterococcus faecalis]MBC2811815.1 peptidase S8 [Enterococcus faecalis]MBC2816068.1 peptidase S8 [Enterococcus faecalis]MBC2818598.1 peptidase S8 [Enterococcus faecalis]